MAAAADPQRASAAALTRVLREEGPRVLATLIRTTGSLQLAEDAVQDAVLRAWQTWPRDGVPAEPRAWLTLTARRCAIDVIRRESRRGEKEVEARALALQLAPDAPVPEDGVVRDDLLRLIFICCHPALAVETQIALALRTLGGLTTQEVAAALLVAPETMTKRLTRAKQKIAAAGIPYATPEPADLPARLRAVLGVIYLMFNEGYHASGGEVALRHGLCEQAIRLVDLVDELLPDRLPVIGLAALLRFQDARGGERVDGDGELRLLSEQDRERWDRARISQGLERLGRALRAPVTTPDPYVVQAAIAACHCLAPAWERTNWEAIVSWYDVLVAVADSPVVRLNRAVAIGELRGAEAGLVALEAVTGLEEHLPYVAARAELLARCERVDEARVGFARALELGTNAQTRRRLTERLAQLG